MPAYFQVYVCFKRLAVHQLAIGLTSHSAVCGSRHVRIKAAPTRVRLAGEKRMAASPGIEKGDTAAQSAAALADDESDDEADREVKSSQLTPLLLRLSRSACILHSPTPPAPVASISCGQLSFERRRCHTIGIDTGKQVMHHCETMAWPCCTPSQSLKQVSLLYTD